MKLDFQAKFLQHLNQKRKSDEGFTLIELLVVIIIIGILAAIALPSLLGQVNKAKQSEAKNNIGALNRAQQAYQLEYSQFETALTALGVGIRSQTENYNYDISGDKAISVVNRGTARKAALKSYAGLVGTVTGDSVTGEVLTVAAACESPTPTQTAYGPTPNGATIASATPCDTWKNLGK
ncbi:MAG: type IV pilin-like G/H family protein [Kastovskya adunca ATA6-11-RM4]|jgi:type IV pilus assembly protein PilA|nr:type IV pilin-like G/H family protein [Kastovskya adunca ATA6-11-RM4]